MSSSTQTLGTSSQLKSILDAALSDYKAKTGNDLTNNSLAKELQNCESVEAVLDIIQREAKTFEKFRSGDKRLMKWIGPSVDVLYTISPILGASVGIVRTIRVIRVALKHHRCAAVSSCQCDLCRNRASPRCLFFRFSFGRPFQY